MRSRNYKIAVGCLILMLAACVKNPFSTRDSEYPYGATGTWETPQAPEVAVRNLLFAYNEMIVSNYQLCFSDSFSFSSPEDSIDAVNDGRGELFSLWSKSVEIDVAGNIFSTFQSEDTLDMFLLLAASGNYSDIIEDSVSVLYRLYYLTLISGSPESRDTTTIEGLAAFHLRAEQLNWWTIYLWEDIPANSGQDDWGDFKARYRR